MAKESFLPYYQRVTNALVSENGRDLADLLSIHGSHISSIKGGLTAKKAAQRESQAQRALGNNWAELVTLHLRVLSILETPYHTQETLVQAAEQQNLVAQCFHQIFAGQSRWCLPVLYTISDDLLQLSKQADKFCEQRNRAVHLEAAARTMNKAFSYCVTDRFSTLDRSRKWGTYRIVNLLFKTYFKLTQTNLCTTILRSLGAGDLPDLDKFPLGDQVTFRYHVGVLAFYNEQYRKAEEELAFALLHTPKHSEVNRSLILNYLIPTRFITGTLPSTALLDRYPAIKYLYGSFAEAIRKGDLQSFDENLSRLQRDLVDRGTYLTVERARGLTSRMLYKKIWIVNDRTTRIPISQFLTAMRLAGVQVSTEAVTCIIANMIDKGYLKGYISYERQTLVMAKDNPFPPVKTITV
ncbi:hypothetical protein DFS34DRAFT_605817 [Phlyctochytrium arcticum]|nr:hypothetical protein DFS34DRAFT_605817 [Phlyctochytrium arcticum]